MATTISKYSAQFKIIKLLVLLAIPVVVLALPASFLDQGESLCLSQRLFALECYGCGMGRALMHLAHLNFQMAYDFNPLSFIVLPLLGLVWAGELKKIGKSLKQSR